MPANSRWDLIRRLRVKLSECNIKLFLTAIGSENPKKGAFMQGIYV